MAEVADNTLEIRIGADIEGFERGTNSATAALEDFQRRVAKAAENIDSTTKRSAAAQAKYLTELAKRYDPAIRAQERYAKSVADINALTKAGIYTQEQAAAALTRAAAMREAAIQREIGANSALVASNNAVVRSTMRTAAAKSSVGTIAQQVGFQVADMAVQIQAGTRPLVALSQQGSQLLGVLGPVGAIAGAATPAVGTPSFHRSAE